MLPPVRSFALKAILLTSILGLCLYSDREYGRMHSSIPEIKEEPERFENVSFRSEGTARNVSVSAATTFTLVVMGDRIQAFYDRPFKLREGDHVIVYGVLHMTEGYLRVTRLHVYKNIPRLYALSVAGLFVVIWLFFRDWRLQRLEWRRRHA